MKLSSFAGIEVSSIVMLSSWVVVELTVVVMAVELTIVVVAVTQVAAMVMAMTHVAVVVVAMT
jgi:hypothetical protein